MGFPLPWPHGYVPSSTSVDGTALAYDTAYLEQGRDRLLHEFKDCPRLAALLGIYLGKLQEIELALWQLLVERTVDTALGVALTHLARKVGVDRSGWADSELRRLVRAEIRVLKSSGNAEDLLAVIRTFLAGATGEQLVELEFSYPAELAVVLLEELTGREAFALARLLHRAKSGGVRLVTEYVVQPIDETFRFSTDPDGEEIDDATGFGWDGDADLGGQFASATEGA